MFWAGACIGVAEEKGLIKNDQRFALREASRYLRAYGMKLYEEYQAKENNDQPGTSDAGKG